MLVLPMQIYMGHLALPEALGMVRHYFGDCTVDSSFEEALRAVFVDGRLSPAALESMCADFDDVAQLLEALGQQKGASSGCAGTTAAGSGSRR